MPLQIEIVARAAAAAPDGPEITDWLQAAGSLFAILAVAAVAWIEHKRAKAAEAAAKEAPHKTDLEVVTAYLDILQRCEAVWLKDYAEVLKSGEGSVKSANPFAHSWATAIRLKEVLDRLLAGRILPVPTLLLGAEIMSTLGWERGDRKFDTVQSARDHASIYIALFRLLTIRAERRQAELLAGTVAIYGEDDGAEARAYADRKLDQAGL